MKQRTFWLALLLLASAGVTIIKAENKETVRIPHEIREIEGWRVQVDTSLLRGEHKPTGDLALKILGQRLHQITMRLPAGPVKKMQEVPIYLDRKHPLGGAHFHPESKWLEDHGYDPAMVKAVQLTSANRLIKEASQPGGGSVVLHELAHAYHNRVLGFDDKDILNGYRKFCASEKFDMVAYSTGGQRPHYGLMDHKEFFAEMTETCFTGNDFYPFTHRDLIQTYPETYCLIAQIWGADLQKERETKLNCQDLRILATLKSQRGDHDEALKLLDNADKQSPGNERVASLRKKIEEERE